MEDLMPVIKKLVTLLLPILGILSIEQTYAGPTAVPYLFKVSSSKGDSYLMGTIHVVISLSDYPNDISQLVKGSAVIMAEQATELDTILQWEKDFVPLMVRSMDRKGPSKIPLDATTRGKIIEYGIPPEIADRTSDDFCYILSEYYLYISRLSSLPMDLQIIKIARINGARVIELDDDKLREQVVSQDNCRLSRVFLNSTVESVRSSVLADFQRLEFEFRKGNVPAEFDSPIDTPRNLAWIEPIEREIKTHRTFIAVGANHLFGQFGLVKLLRDRGFQVARVVN